MRRTSIDAQKRPAMSLIDARRDIPDSIAKGKEAITRNSRDRASRCPGTARIADLFGRMETMSLPGHFNR
jgi:hypothetical protein